MARARQGQAEAKPKPVLLLATLGVLALLALSVDERTFGSLSDEEQVLRTAVAMAEFGEMGIARGPLFSIHRPQGDAISPYGIGQSLVEVPAACLADGWERRFGSGSSQTLFVALQLVLVAAGALGAALLARALGAEQPGVLVALFGTAFGSPLWVYASTGFSEPLQAASLVFSLLFAVHASREEPRREPPRARRLLAMAAAAGACAGVAVLAKGLNLALVPFVLLPLVLRREGRITRLGGAALGFLPLFGAFLAFEIVRFGRPFASYGGFGFTHPFFDGFWRLLVGINKGLVWYFPLAVAGVAGVLLLARAAPASRAAAVGLFAPLAVLVALASAWWAWDGTVGWGPRLLVPAIPLLAAAAGVAARGRWRRPAWALLAAGAVLNALGVFQSPPASAAYLGSLPPATLTPAIAKRYPADFLAFLPDGSALIDREHLAASAAALAPFRVHAFLLGVRLTASSPQEFERRLASPPWARSRPDLVPSGTGGGLGAVQALSVYDRQPFSWPHLFAASPLPRDPRADAFHAAWDAALVDQLLRALDIGRPDRALAPCERLFSLTPSGYSAALYAEALRVSGRKETLAELLRGLPGEFRSSPSLGVVEALAARDAGDEATARRILSAVARVFPRPALVAAVDQPLSAWPNGLHAMTGDNRRGSRLALPAVGVK
jgi:hypothetical protein